MVDKVDWQRRRVLTVESAVVCTHGELLIVWCRECGLDLDALIPPYDASAA